jgi:hypothetical protein
VIAGTVGSVLAAAGFVFLAVRSRRARHPCRVCGVVVPDSDLCPACRHEAAEARRHAAVERAHNERAQEEEERRKREYEAEQRELEARRDDGEARVRDQELARQQQEEQQQPQHTDKDAQPQSHAAVVPLVPAVEEDEVFDPYVVLGVPCEAGQDDICTAYQKARTKYDPDLVSHLGDEAQTHFKEKAQSVERAYRMLSDLRR